MCTKISIAYKVDIPGRQKPVFLPSIILSTDLFITSKNRLSLAFATQKCQRAFYLLMRLRYYIIKWNMSGFVLLLRPWQYLVCICRDLEHCWDSVHQNIMIDSDHCWDSVHQNIRIDLEHCWDSVHQYIMNRFRALLGQCASVYHE